VLFLSFFLIIRGIVGLSILELDFETKGLSPGEAADLS
jgi:hypothetical protein